MQLPQMALLSSFFSTVCAMGQLTVVVQTKPNKKVQIFTTECTGFS